MPCSIYLVFTSIAERDIAAKWRLGLRHPREVGPGGTPLHRRADTQLHFHLGSKRIEMYPSGYRCLGENPRHPDRPACVDLPFDLESVNIAPNIGDTGDHTRTPIGSLLNESVSAFQC